MSDSAFVLLNGIARGFRDSIVGMVRVYQMDRQQSDEADSGEGSAGEETPTVLARRRAARKKRIAGSPSKDRFVGKSPVCKLTRLHGLVMMMTICSEICTVLFLIFLQVLFYKLSYAIWYCDQYWCWLFGYRVDVVGWH